MGNCICASTETIYKDVVYKDTVKYVPPIKYGKVIKVYDGDTFTIAVRMPEISKKIFYRFSVRIRHIDCPELQTHNMYEKEVALIAKKMVHDLIFGKIVRLDNIIYDKYGRLCCDVHHQDTNIGDMLLQNGLAVAYEGKTKMSPDNWKTYYEFHQKARCVKKS